MLTAAEFAQLASLTGEPVVFHQTKAPNAVVNVGRAVIQNIDKRAGDAIVNAYGVNGHSVQIAASILGATVPEKYDYVMRGTEKLVFDAVLPQHSRQTGAVTYYLAYVKGR